MSIPTGGTTSAPMKAIYSGALKRLRKARYTQSLTMKILAFCFDRLRRMTAASVKQDLYCVEVCRVVVEVATVYVRADPDATTDELEVLALRSDLSHADWRRDEIRDQAYVGDCWRFGES